MTFMSSELKARLSKVVEEGYQHEKTAIEENMPKYKTFLLKIANQKKLDVLIWMEGTDQRNLDESEKNFSVLERANLIIGETKYTHRNVYRQYELTKIGAEIAEKIAKEN